MCLLILSWDRLKFSSPDLKKPTEVSKPFKRNNFYIWSSSPLRTIRAPPTLPPLIAKITQGLTTVLGIDYKLKYTLGTPNLQGR